jgi:hypothetical protein
LVGAGDQMFRALSGGYRCSRNRESGESDLSVELRSRRKAQGDQPGQEEKEGKGAMRAPPGNRIRRVLIIDLSRAHVQSLSPLFSSTFKVRVDNLFIFQEHSRFQANLRSVKFYLIYFQ